MEVQFLAGRVFSLHYCIPTGSGAHPVPYLMGIMFLLWMLNDQGLKVTLRLALHGTVPLLSRVSL
jgi:hypothetical protein